ncbi:MAG: TolC family protein [Bacteroidetes bacterium]|nr:TolC family protein [Bacteroidota bacterium]
MNIKPLLLTFLSIALLTVPSVAQISNDSTLQSATLENIIQYTLRHQPAVQKSVIDEQITRSQINSRLADWYPQIDFNYNLQHNSQLPSTVFQGQVIQLGNQNTSVGNFAYNQNILNRDLLLAAHTAKDTRRLSAQITENNRINAVAEVSKAFYSVLLSRQQIDVNSEDIIRLERSVKDAKARYDNGIVDKTDYQRATIALNNAKALQRSNQEALKARLQVLKQIMGYPMQSDLQVTYDSLKMEGEVSMDVAKTPDYNNRIEYQSLLTQKKLQTANVQYAKNSFIPILAGFADYNMNFLNNNFGDLYNKNYPSSYAGVTLAFPLVRGGKRLMGIRQAKWQLRKTDWDLTDLQNNINAEYAQAEAAYMGSLANYTALKENMTLAQQVYNTIDLQYRSGVKTYLEVVTAESDLRTAQINYYNALYQVLSGKIDLQRASGQLKF